MKLCKMSAIDIYRMREMRKNMFQGVYFEYFNYVHD